MRVAEVIRRKLEAALSPERLEIVDDSARHAGHAGAREGGESHFSIAIVSSTFMGKSKIARHRVIHGLLAEELAGPVHALSVSALTPEEFAARRGRAASGEAG